MDKRFEVWVWDVDAYQDRRDGFRFNARFDSMERAQLELQWYHARHIPAEIWIDGVTPDRDDTDGVLEYAEGSGG